VYHRYEKRDTRNKKRPYKAAQTIEEETETLTTRGLNVVLLLAGSWLGKKNRLALGKHPGEKNL